MFPWRRARTGRSNEWRARLLRALRSTRACRSRVGSMRVSMRTRTVAATGTPLPRRCRAKAGRWSGGTVAARHAQRAPRGRKTARASSRDEWFRGTCGPTEVCLGDSSQGFWCVPAELDGGRSPPPAVATRAGAAGSNANRRPGPSARTTACTASKWTASAGEPARRSARDPVEQCRQASVMAKGWTSCCSTWRVALPGVGMLCWVSARHSLQPALRRAQLGAEIRVRGRAVMAVASASAF